MQRLGRAVVTLEATDEPVTSLGRVQPLLAIQALKITTARIGNHPDAKW